MQVTIAVTEEEAEVHKEIEIEDHNEAESRYPIPYECCGEIICQCQYPDPINWDDYTREFEEALQEYKTDNEPHDKSSGDETTNQPSTRNAPVINVSLEEIVERHSTQDEEY